MPRVTILTPCYNEEANVRELHRKVGEAMRAVPDLEYEHLFIDNASTDATVSILRALADADEKVKVIVNTRNFGPVRSPYYGFLQAGGDAVLTCSADLQDPPELLPEFVEKWREGFKVVVGIKAGSREGWVIGRIRRFYYWLSGGLADVQLIPNFTGWGLYDREVVEQFRATHEQYPYFRGTLCDFGYERAEVMYVQPARAGGKSNHSLYSLYDIAMLGITNHSKVPLRIASMTGFTLSILSLFVAFVYLVIKLLYWNTFSVGLAPLLIGIYFFGAVQLFFVGVLGEYIGSIHTQVHKRPLVVEKERINFE